MNAFFKNPMITGESFAFARLHEDVKAYALQHNITLADISSGELFRSKSYLSARISEKKAPLNVLLGVCRIIDKPMARYEIQPEKPATVAWKVEHVCEPEKGRIGVIISKGDEVLAKRWAWIKEPRTDLCIVQAISYATHLCYKAVEQLELEAL